MSTPTTPKVVAGTDMLPTTPLDGALFMLKRGFRVFPIKPNSKEPYARNDPEKALCGGIHRATDDPEKVKRWVAKYPTINFGVRMDEVGLDCDAKVGPQWVADLNGLGSIPPTLVVRTTTGGLHYYFAGDPCGQAKIAKTIDVRSAGGYLVARVPLSTANGTRSKRITRSPRSRRISARGSASHTRERSRPSTKAIAQ